MSMLGTSNDGRSVTMAVCNGTDTAGAAWMVHRPHERATL